MKKHIVVFGATSAIATAVLEEYLKEDVHLYLIARNQEKLHTLLTDWQIRYPQATLSSQLTDLSDTKQHAELIQNIITSMPRIDIAFLCHGSLSNQSQCEQSYDKTYQELTINLLSMISLLTHLANHMQQQRQGTIAVLSSVAGDRGRQKNYVYGTAKAALTTFLQGLRNRLFKHGVHVITIKPGFIESPMTIHHRKNKLFCQPRDVAKHIKHGIDTKKNVLYTPRFWAGIMLIFKLIPENIFKRMSL